MGADPIAMCGGCRKIVGYFSLTACVECINVRYLTDIDEHEGRLITKNNQINNEWEPNCHLEYPCEALLKIDDHLKKGHKIVVDPCW